MACSSTKAYALIQGSDTTFGGNHFIKDYFVTELDLDGYTAKLEVPKANFSKDLELKFDDTERKTYVLIDFTAEETNKMPLGDQPIMVVIYNQEGLQSTLESITIKVLKRGVATTNVTLNQELLVGEEHQVKQLIVTPPHSHTWLMDRDEADQHPMSAITGLSTTLTTLTEGLYNETQERQAEDARIDARIDEKFSGYLPVSTRYGSRLVITMDPDTYVVTLQLKDQNGAVLGEEQKVDLPVESVVVGGRYDSDTKEVILTLVNGTEIRFSVADLVSGLQPEITQDNKVSADLINDSNSVNKFVTAADKENWNGKQDKGDYALKSEIPNKVSALENDKGYLTEHQDISGLATKQELAGKQDFIQDLPAIRSGSALGSTAVQSATLNDYATKQALTDGLATKQPVGDYATKQELNGKQDKIPDLAEIREGASKGETAVQPNTLIGYQTTSNLVTSLSSSSTNSQYPSAKCVYDIIGNIETLLSQV